VHDGPVLDLKYDAHFGRLASVGNGFPQVSELLTTDGGEHFLTLTADNMLMMAPLAVGMLRPIISSPTSSRYNVISIHFCDDGASILVCTLETHKMFVFYRLYHILLT
jgi:hypothetical protein